MFKPDGTIDLQAIVDKAATGFMMKSSALNNDYRMLYEKQGPRDLLRFQQHENRALCAILCRSRHPSPYKEVRGLIIPFTNNDDIPQSLEPIRISKITAHMKGESEVARVKDENVLVIPQKFLEQNGLYDLLDQMMRAKFIEGKQKAVTQDLATAKLDAYYAYKTLPMDGKVPLPSEAEREHVLEQFINEMTVEELRYAFRNMHYHDPRIGRYVKFSKLDKEEAANVTESIIQQTRESITKRHNNQYNRFLNTPLDGYICDIQPLSVDIEPNKNLSETFDINTDASEENVEFNVNQALIQAQNTRALVTLKFPERELYVIPDEDLAPKFNRKTSNANLKTLFDIADKDAPTKTILLTHTGTGLTVTNNKTAAQLHLQAQGTYRRAQKLQEKAYAKLLR